MNDNADDTLPLQMKGDSWFGSVKSAVNLAQRGMHGIFNVKQAHALYPKDFIADVLKNAPGGVHIVLKGRHEGHTIIAIGYRYSSKSTLFFVMTDGAGSTTPGKPYEMKFIDEHGNVGEFKFVQLFYFYIMNLKNCFIYYLYRNQIRRTTRRYSKVLP